MPVHDWTRVDAGLFHAFHQRWISALSDALNGGVLPPDYFALPEQTIGPIPDVLTLRLAQSTEPTGNGSCGIAVAAAPPKVKLVQRAEREVYAAKADRLTIRHRHGHIVSVVEIVSPGNKGSNTAIRAFVEKAADLIRQGVHLLVIDLFPPGKRDPQRLHKEVWNEFQEEDVMLPVDKPLTLSSYSAGTVPTAYVEPIAVGDALPDMPLFLASGTYVPAPLEATYQASWAVFPAALKPLLVTAK